MTVHALKEAIAGLPDDDRHSLAAWLNDLRYDARGRQMLHDFTPGGRGMAWADIRHSATKQCAVSCQNPRYPSLQLKPVGEFWSARVNDAYRALAVREGNIFTWFWIGSHDDDERMLNG